MTSEKGIVRPVRTARTPQLGPLAIMVATDADLQILRRTLGLPDSRKLFLSRIDYHSADPRLPALVGPVMGAPYAVMVLETLLAWGVKSVLFAGWCGSISSGLRIGDILLPDSAVIDEGTSPHYAQRPGDAVRPHSGLHNQVASFLRERDAVFYNGRIWSTDGIFRETPAKIKHFQNCGAIAVEMELSALFSAARMVSLPIAAMLVVSDELFTLKWQPGFNHPAFKSSRDTVCTLLSKIHRSLS